LRYFVEDYDLDYYAAFPGCSDQTEASNQTIAFLVDKVKSEKIPVVLKIEMSSDAIARTIAREAGVEYLTFNSAHTISAEDFDNGKTYADIMESNLDVLREALN
jgi:zinc transport system substrate-binding protein